MKIDAHLNFPNILTYVIQENQLLLKGLWPLKYEQ